MQQPPTNTLTLDMTLTENLTLTQNSTLIQNLTLTQNFTLTLSLTLTQNFTLTLSLTLTQIDFADKGFIIKTLFLWAFLVNILLHSHNRQEVDCQIRICE